MSSGALSPGNGCCDACPAIRSYHPRRDTGAGRADPRSSSVNPLASARFGTGKLSPVAFGLAALRSWQASRRAIRAQGGGGRKRSANVAVEISGTVTPVGELSLKITRGDHRPWTERWLTVLHRRDALRATYSDSALGLGDSEIDRRAMAFFVECDHLRDWLKGDLNALPGVTAAGIDNHAQGSVPLRRCNAISNTDKHHTRRLGTTARIRETSITPTGARVSIEVDWASPNATTIDALDLANECVESWRSFFTTFGITAP